MRTTRHHRHRLAAVTLVAATLLAACGGGGDAGDGDTAAANGDVTGTTAPAAGGTDRARTDADDGASSDATDPGDSVDTSETTAGGDGGESGGGNDGGTPTGATATSAPGGGSASATGEPARRAEPAAPGRYEYDVDGQATFSAGAQEQTRPLPEEAVLTIDPPRGEQQRSVREAKDDQGNGTVTETVLQFAADGVHLVRLKTTTTASGISDTREFRPSPPPLLIPAGAAPGSHTEFTMTSTDGRTTADVSVDVRGTETVQVAGTRIEALMLDVRSRFSGDIEGTQEARNWVDQERSLTVKERSETDARVGLNELHSEYQAVIRSLSPA